MRRHRLEVLALTIILASAAAVAAQSQESPRTRVRTHAGSGTVIVTNGEHTDTMRLGERRGRLGITVDMRPDASRDSIGARVAGITTPNSAAARAGVQVGDIVTRFNGTPLGVTGRAGEEGQPRILINGEQLEEDRSRPAMRLINLASRLNAGDTVRLDLKRGTQNVNATLVAGESDMDMMVEHMSTLGEFGGRMRMPGGDGPMMPFMQGMEGPRTLVLGGPISDLELASLTSSWLPSPRAGVPLFQLTSLTSNSQLVTFLTPLPREHAHEGAE